LPSTSSGRGTGAASSSRWGAAVAVDDHAQSGERRGQRDERADRADGDERGVVDVRVAGGGEIARSLPARTEPVAVDVRCERTIPRPRGDVAAYAADPDTATAWYSNIKAVHWETPPPLAVGSRLAFVATFLGRRLSYTYEIRELVPGERLVMSTAQGPFPMETTYTWEDAPDGATRMTLQNRGEPSGFRKVAAPVMARAMRRAMTKDLERLSAILERRL
jgi:uncharacterized protein YndB with AHSA1/START domain